MDPLPPVPGSPQDFLDLADALEAQGDHDLATAAVLEAAERLVRSVFGTGSDLDAIGVGRQAASDGAACPGTPPQAPSTRRQAQGGVRP
ncbi:hypothetical protein [Rubrivirga sp.]|uniref:hypothetical protein n=1 Tax=Rubrivirga sp. TaxID=1885344 RepID=UPI003C73DC45